MANFQKAFKYVLGNEGKYSNHPQDKGGPTNWGIIQSEYTRWLKRPASIDDMKAMPLAHAEAIYKAKYWTPLKCDQIVSDAVATAIFDQGVNRGIGWPPKKIQMICGVTQDGDIGPVTLKALNAMSETDFITKFEVIVEKSYRDIVARNPSQGVFLRGWLNRAKRLLTLLKRK